MKTDNNIEQLEKKIMCEFKNKDLIKTALTHSSYANEKKNIRFNERLEFLGDSVLQLSISEYLFNKFPNRDEGELTKLRSLIVCENALFEIAQGWKLGNYIFMSKGEEITGGRTRTSILADCVEAVIAAVYLDSDFNCARSFIMKHFDNIIKKAINNDIVLDYKTKFQEILQKDGEVSIEYVLKKYEGPPHRRKFYVDLNVNEKFVSCGEGYSKKEAEQSAAKNAVERKDILG